MKRAEIAALERYPKRKDGRVRYFNCTDDDARRIYAKGHRKAEKDMALTWEDMKIINNLGSIVIDEHLHDGWTLEQVYKEVLRRFNAYKTKNE